MKKLGRRVRVIRSARKITQKKVKVSWTLRCNLKWRWSTHKHTSQTFNSKESHQSIPVWLQKKNRKRAHENRKKTTNLSKLTDSRIPPTKILWCPKLGGGFNTNWTILVKLHHSPGIGVKIKMLETTGHVNRTVLVPWCLGKVLFHLSYEVWNHHLANFHNSQHLKNVIRQP